MLDLGKHINDLLYNYDCVIVPGLGGFVANNKNATLNDKTGVFSPPRREIGFNKSLSHNDGLLISHMASAHAISFEDCNGKLAKHVLILKEQLKQGESVSIGLAGELKNDTLDNTFFIPNITESFCIDSFGLSTFNFRTLDQVKEQNDTSNHWVRRTLQSGNVRQIAASVALIMGMLFITPEFGNQTQQTNLSSMLPKIEQKALVSDVDAISSIPVSTEIATVANNAIAEVKVETDVAESITQTNSFFIIGASFKEEYQAKRFLNNLTRKGNQSAQIIAANGNYRVSLQGFSDKETAIEALNQHRTKNGSNSAWLLKH